jgi:hypothetical protein
MSADPLRDDRGRFRQATWAERVFGPAAAPPPASPPKPKAKIPAGPMGTQPPEADDLIRLALRHLRR